MKLTAVFNSIIVKPQTQEETRCSWNGTQWRPDNSTTSQCDESVFHVLGRCWRWWSPKQNDAGAVWLSSCKLYSQVVRCWNHRPKSRLHLVSLRFFGAQVQAQGVQRRCCCSIGSKWHPQVLRQHRQVVHYQHRRQPRALGLFTFCRWVHSPHCVSEVVICWLPNLRFCILEWQHNDA